MLSLQHEPQRTCVACRQRKPQALLLRLSRLANGEVVPWRSGGAGRSAYVCLSLGCLQTAARQRSFERVWARRGVVKVEPKVDLGCLIKSCIDALVNEARFLYRSQQRADERREAIASLLTQVQSPARGLPQAIEGRA